MAFVYTVPFTSNINNNRSLLKSQHVTTTRKRPNVFSQVESPSPSPSKTEDETSTTPKETFCEGCGRNGGPVGGCDGNGRIAGGLGAVVDWWPIKAYRPCPEFLNAKKKYKRAGQSLDEIAFGRKGQDDDKSIMERLDGK